MHQQLIKMSRLCAAGLLAVGAASAAHAQSYPSRPIHVVIAYNPGGTTDPVGRIFADVLRDGFKAVVVTENKGGAGGSIGTAYVKTQPADGYTLLVHTNSVTLQAATVAAPIYDPVKDLAPITMLTSLPMEIVVPKNSPFANLGDMVKAAKERPGKLNLAHGGFGTYGWYTMMRYMLDEGFKLTDVPYTSAAAVQMAVLKGEADMAIDSPAGVGKFVQDGSMRALALSGEERSRFTPDIPTGKEQGQAFRGIAWVGMMAPAGTDPKIVNAIYEQLKAGAAKPDVKERVAKLGMDLDLREPAAFGRSIADEFATTKRIITTQKIPLQ